MENTTKPIIDANALESMAKQRPEEKFLKGSGVLKLIQAIRDLERANRELRAEQTAPSAAAATEVENLRKALQFYADKDHFTIADDGAWDTVSGEPQNYWCDEEGTATVEDGTIARLALAGHQIKFDADAAPQPSPTPQADSAPLAAPADIVVLEAALRAIHQAIDLIGEPDTERLRAVRRVLRGAVVVAEDSTAPQADSQPAQFVDQNSENLSDKAACASPVIDKPAAVLDRDRIREIFMAHGFTVKEGQTDLKQYVYDAADALLRAASAPADSVTAPAGGGVVAPSEPTSSMYRAAQMILLPTGDDDGGSIMLNTSQVRALWQAMLAAAPTQPTQAADSVLEDADPIRALIAEHAAVLDQNESAYFELCYHRATGWMAWITDKPLCMPPVVNPDRKVLAQGQGDTADEACRDAARKQGGV